MPRRSGGKSIPGQLYLPFKELKNTEPQETKADTVILFHLPKEIKDNLATQARLKNLSVTKLLNELISKFLSTIKAEKRGRKATGRGNVDLKQVEKVKEYMREHREGVLPVDVARYVGCNPVRAIRLLDLLSGVGGREVDFLVYEDDMQKPIRYFIAKDTQRGGTGYSGKIADPDNPRIRADNH